MSASSAMVSVTLACRSRVTAIGRPRPTLARSACRSAPSPSSACSVTMAPWSGSNRPSTGPPSSSAARISAVKASKAARVTLPEGVASAMTTGTGVQSWRSQASKNAATSVLVPR